MKRWIKVKYGEFQVFFVWKYCYNPKNTAKVLFSVTIAIVLVPLYLVADFGSKMLEYIRDNIPKLNPVKVLENPEYNSAKNRKEKIEYWRNKLNIK